MHYFADTSFLVAWFNRDDDNHGKATSFMAEAEKERRTATRIVLTDYVFDEVVTTIRFQTRSHALAVQAGRVLLGSKATSIVRVGEKTFTAAWSLFESRKDKKWSFTDCTSFTVMKEMGFDTALALDDDFKKAGFSTLP